jgi:preprotein translocase subunit SecF
MEQIENKIKFSEKFKRKFISFHDKNYKKLLIIPIVLIILGFVYMGYFYSNSPTHDFFNKDISLSGGTSVTINIINQPININDLKNNISGKLGEVDIREISDLISGQQKAVVVEIKTETCDQSQVDSIKSVLENYLNYSLIEGKNSNFECTGSSLGGDFYRQLLFSVLIAFVLMSIVVFIQFKTFVPSIAVITSAFADIFMSLVLVNILGIRISGAGIVAFLMLIGYSVDTDILLTNKVLRREGKSLNRKIMESFKTGITMTLTALLSTILSLILVGSLSPILYQIFLILTIGLCFDILNTWLTNVSIIKWYANRKNENKS